MRNLTLSIKVSFREEVRRRREEELEPGEGWGGGRSGKRGMYSRNLKEKEERKSRTKEDEEGAGKM